MSVSHLQLRRMWSRGIILQSGSLDFDGPVLDAANRYSAITSESLRSYKIWAEHVAPGNETVRLLSKKAKRGCTPVDALSPGISLPKGRIPFRRSLTLWIILKVQLYMLMRKMRLDLKYMTPLKVGLQENSIAVPIME